MDTRFLGTFLVAIETGSLAETARRLNITSSAVVQRIRVLEQDIGKPLLRREGHSMLPTTAGVAIAVDARRLLAVEDQIRSAASADQIAGELRIGVVHTVLTGLMPSLLEALKRDRPELRPYILPGLSDDLYRRVVDKDLDVSIIVKPHFQVPKYLAWEFVRREPLVLIIPADLEIEDALVILRREPFIRYDRNHWGGRLVESYLKRQRVRPKELFELDSLEAISILVSRGLGVAIVPDWPRPWPEGVSIRRIPLIGGAAREIGLLWSRNSSRLPRIRALVDEARVLGAIA